MMGARRALLALLDPSDSARIVFASFLAREALLMILIRQDIFGAVDDQCGAVASLFTEFSVLIDSCILPQSACCWVVPLFMRVVAGLCTPLFCYVLG